MRMERKPEEKYDGKVRADTSRRRGDQGERGTDVGTGDHNVRHEKRTEKRLSRMGVDGGVCHCTNTMLGGMDGYCGAAGRTHLLGWGC